MSTQVSKKPKTNQQIITEFGPQEPNRAKPRTLWARVTALLDRMTLTHGVGSDAEHACTIAAINLALTGRLSDGEDPCISEYIRAWVITVQDMIPISMMVKGDEHGDRWRKVMPRIAGSIVVPNDKVIKLATQWMWDTLAIIRPKFTTSEARVAWLDLLANKTADKARDFLGTIPMSQDYLRDMGMSLVQYMDDISSLTGHYNILSRVSYVVRFAILTKGSSDEIVEWGWMKANPAKLLAALTDYYVPWNGDGITKYLGVHGDPGRGFTYHGPWDTDEDAREGMKGMDNGWWITTMTGGVETVVETPMAKDIADWDIANRSLTDQVAILTKELQDTKDNNSNIVVNFKELHIKHDALVKAMSLSSTTPTDDQYRKWLQDTSKEGFLCHEVEFTGADLSYSRFGNTILQHASFIGATINRGAFRDANLTGSIFESATMQNTSFYKANLRTATFYQADMHDVNMVDVNAQCILTNDGRGYSVIVNWLSKEQQVEHKGDYGGTGDDGNGVTHLFRVGCRLFTYQEAYDHWDEAGEEYAGEDNGQTWRDSAANIMAAITAFEINLQAFTGHPSS